jgi:hypothetical protein
MHAPSEALASMPPRSRFLLQIDQYVVVICLTVRLPFQSYNLFLILIVGLQMCVWDWALSLSDELEMVRHGNQLRRYLYDVLYLVVR